MGANTSKQEGGVTTPVTPVKPGQVSVTNNGSLTFQPGSTDLQQWVSNGLVIKCQTPTPTQPQTTGTLKSIAKGPVQPETVVKQVHYCSKVNMFLNVLILICLIVVIAMLIKHVKKTRR